MTQRCRSCLFDPSLLFGGIECLVKTDRSRGYFSAEGKSLEVHLRNTGQLQTGAVFEAEPSVVGGIAQNDTALSADTPEFRESCCHQAGTDAPPLTVGLNRDRTQAVPPRRAGRNRDRRNSDMAHHHIVFYRHQGNCQRTGTAQRSDDELLRMACVRLVLERRFG